MHHHSNQKVLAFSLAFYFEDKDTNLDSAHGDEKEEKSVGQGKIAFFCGNPMVEIIQGIIHIYKNK